MNMCGTEGEGREGERQGFEAVTPQVLAWGLRRGGYLSDLNDAVAVICEGKRKKSTI